MQGTDLEGFEKAANVVSRLKKSEIEHTHFQEIIQDEKVVYIKTSKGVLRVNDEYRVNRIMSLIDGFYWEEDERLKKELESI